MVGSGFDSFEEGGEPLFIKMSLEEMRTQIGGNPFSIINGQFFDPRATPTRLSFGLKVHDEIRSVGADNGSARKNILSIGKGWAQISPYTDWTSLRDAPGDFVMVNLAPEAKHHTNSLIGRTLLCLRNPDAHNKSQELMVLSAVALNEVRMKKEAIKHGCSPHAMTQLDSSGSARLWYNGEYIYGHAHKGVPDKRKIPHGIAFYDAM